MKSLLSAKGLGLLQLWGPSESHLSFFVSITFRGRNACLPLRFDGFCGKSGEDLLVRDDHGPLHAGG